MKGEKGEKGETKRSSNLNTLAGVLLGTSPGDLQAEDLPVGGCQAVESIIHVTS